VCSFSKWYSSFDGGILSAILQVLTRYSANDPQFPVNDQSLFTGVPATGKSHAIGGAARANGPADGEHTGDGIEPVTPYRRISRSLALTARMRPGFLGRLVMDGSIWLFLVLSVVALCIVLAGLRPRPAEIEKSRHCPHCETPVSPRRVPIFESLIFRGAWMCPHCGARVYKRRGKVTSTVA
jgi:hypothetical protein